MARTPVDLVAEKPKNGTPTSVEGSSKVTIGGVVVCMKGESMTGGGNEKSPYRERAAYLIANMIGLRDLVPPTALHTLDGKVVSIQKWVSGRKPTPMDRQPKELLLFDYIIANTDRHQWNWFTRTNGKVWAIDNAYSFNTVLLDNRWSHIPAPPKIILRLETLLANPHLVYRRLGKLLSRQEMDEVLMRMANVDMNGNYPA